ncbi:hypothetical protein [Viridibacillus arvi]|uniref:hypothetical protein n=1 Tax=Viridibacillus arvi TaxID=263475 RepID=UPI0034CD825B
MIDVRSDITSPSDIKKIADVLHEMPLYLAKNLEGFDDETFWKGALKYHGGILDLIYSWFEMGVVTNLSVEDMEYGDSFK